MINIIETSYKIYGKIQYLYHQYTGRVMRNEYSILYCYTKDDINFQTKDATINGSRASSFPKTTDFKGDNIIQGHSEWSIYHQSIAPTLMTNSALKAEEDKWLMCIKAAKVESGWKNSGFYLTAYIKEKKQW